MRSFFKLKLKRKLELTSFFVFRSFVFWVPKALGTRR